MKKNDLILLLSVVLYSWMFYQQTPGINFLVFTIGMIAALLLQNRSLLRDRSWYTAASGSLVSAVCVTIYGTHLSVIANVVSLSLMSALSVSRGSSVFLAGLYSLFSYMSSIAYMIIDSVQRRAENGKPRAGKFWIRLTIGLGIFIVVLVFFFLYKDANPLFRDLTKKIRLDFISWRWVRFTLLGLLLLYGFLYSRYFPKWHAKDRATSDALNKDAILNKGSRLFGKSLNVKLEVGSGVVLIILLNILLAIVNVLDIIYLWVLKEWPEGMTFAEYVHQGAGTLIISILLAVLIILFYFRGFLNYFEKSKTLRAVVYIWLIQNAFVIVSTAYRNQLYINGYYLTNLRIGVYLWLLLTFIGLVFTAIKIAKRKNNWFLWRRNGWAFYVVLVLYAGVNWDLLITRYNVQKSGKLDRYYLNDLYSPTNIPDLMSLPQDDNDLSMSTPEVDPYLLELPEYSAAYMEGGNGDYQGNFTATLHKRLYWFLLEMEENGWQSWCWADQKAADEIQKMSREGKLSSIYLRDQNIDSLGPIAGLTNTVYLDLANNNVQDLTKLQGFSKLEVLYLSNNKIYEINMLPVLTKLKMLYLNNNTISDFTVLKDFTSLEVLDIAYNTGVINLRSLGELKNLRELNLAGNEVKEYSALSWMKQLESLDISAQINADFASLPEIPWLKKLSIASNGPQLINNFQLLRALEGFQGLEQLDISGNNIGSLLILTNYYRWVLKIHFFYFFQTQNRTHLNLC